MIDPAQLVFNPAAPQVQAFAPTSRYFGLKIVSYKAADGSVHAYVSRRVVPLPQQLASVGEYVVAQGERADLIAAATLGDPELYWRLCDGNGVLDPAELEQARRRLRVTLPEGLSAQRSE